jgi:hypothetical protein
VFRAISHLASTSVDGGTVLGPCLYPLPHADTCPTAVVGVKGRVWWPSADWVWKGNVGGERSASMIWGIFCWGEDPVSKELTHVFNDLNVFSGVRGLLHQRLAQQCLGVRVAVRNGLRAGFVGDDGPASMFREYVVGATADNVRDRGNGGAGTQRNCEGGAYVSHR